MKKIDPKTPIWKLTVEEFLEVSKNQLVKMDVFMPSEKEQIAIGNFFRQLDEAIASHQRKLEHMQALKKGLLQQMFV